MTNGIPNMTTGLDYIKGFFSNVVGVDQYTLSQLDNRDFIDSIFYQENSDKKRDFSTSELINEIYIKLGYGNNNIYNSLATEYRTKGGDWDYVMENYLYPLNEIDGDNRSNNEFDRISYEDLGLYNSYGAVVDEFKDITQTPATNTPVNNNEETEVVDDGPVSSTAPTGIEGDGSPSETSQPAADSAPSSLYFKSDERIKQDGNETYVMVQPYSMSDHTQMGCIWDIVYNSYNDEITKEYSWKTLQQAIYDANGIDKNTIIHPNDKIILPTKEQIQKSYETHHDIKDINGTNPTAGSEGANRTVQEIKTGEIKSTTGYETQETQETPENDKVTGDSNGHKEVTQTEEANDANGQEVAYEPNPEEEGTGGADASNLSILTNEEIKEFKNLSTEKQCDKIDEIITDSDKMSAYSTPEEKISALDNLLEITQDETAREHIKSWQNAIDATKYIVQSYDGFQNEEVKKRYIKDIPYSTRLETPEQIKYALNAIYAKEDDNKEYINSWLDVIDKIKDVSDGLIEYQTIYKNNHAPIENIVCDLMEVYKNNYNFTFEQKRFILDKLMTLPNVSDVIKFNQSKNDTIELEIEGHKPITLTQ